MIQEQDWLHYRKEVVPKLRYIMTAKYHYISATRTASSLFCVRLRLQVKFFFFFWAFFCKDILDVNVTHITEGWLDTIVSSYELRWWRSETTPYMWKLETNIWSQQHNKGHEINHYSRCVTPYVQVQVVILWTLYSTQDPPPEEMSYMIFCVTKKI